ncbi:amidohydrolase [Leekyejoonella antrihumi]|uniref:Amidohydrolase n=1 Tax=Leekyejoonella antrihumi TaxID=1660198 RepID=A0A563E7K9_9MICO|nr:amidohydrolase [Leekyejoonella antrihumi]TWP38497.1 amidohydrolase [Leekyejoonella antrihumi]
MSADDLIVYPARQVRTMDPSRPTARAIAVRGDRIRAVGSLDELAAYGEFSIDTRYQDKVILPGFVEAHTHVMSGGMWDYVYVGYYDRTDPDGHVWEGCTTTGAVVDRLREAASNLSSPDETLLAWGLDPIFFPGERLDRHDLDVASRDRAIVVTHQSGHLLTVNSKVLANEGITRATTVEGVVKDASGEPTGELQEPAAMSLVRSVPTARVLSFEAAAAWRFGADARNHGVTTLTDLGSTVLMNDDMVRVYRAAVDDPDFPARISVFYRGASPEESTSPTAVVKKILELRRSSSDKLRFGHVKLVLDGSIQGFTARLQEPGYLPDARKGIWIIPPETFAQSVGLFHDAGLTVHVHCNGDEATELFLDTIEAALERHPRWNHRHTVTHSQLTTAAQYRRMAELGMCANIFSNHTWYWGDQHRDLILGPDRASRMNAAATALRCGVPTTLHCDTPVTPLDPLATASYAADRRTSSGQILGEYERISVHQALHAMTLGAAYTLKMDHEIGSLEAGKYADFAILGDDPWDKEAPALREIEVFGSVVGGRHFPKQ